MLQLILQNKIQNETIIYANSDLCEINLNE